MMSRKCLIMIRGLPGSGKSTLARDLIQRGVADCHCEADHYFYDQQGQYNWDPTVIMDAHDWCGNQVKMALGQGRRVIVSNTSLRLRDVRAYVEIAEHLGCLPLKIVTMHGEYGSVHGVPEETMEKMRLRFADDDAIQKRFGGDVELISLANLLTS